MTTDRTDARADGIPAARDVAASARPEREPRAGDGVRSDDGSAVPADPAGLVEAIRRGDGDAFERLARETAPRLLRLAMRLCRNREDAEDLVQETLVRALPALRGFEGRAALSTYLLRALTNLWRNRLRARKRSRIVAWFSGREEEGPEPTDPLPSALARLETVERDERIRRAVEALEPQRKLVLLLREVEELSYEEIAVVTGVPVGTVRSRLARARDDLRRRLSEPT